MGITLREVLESPFFADYKVLAGKSGINKEIQGVTVLDAPDGYKWTKGRELVISSGYVFERDDNLFYEYTKSEFFPKNSGLAIKFGRFIDYVPSEILQKFDEAKVPLISIPNEHSWMDIMNAINVTVMNKNIHRFDIGDIGGEGKLSSTYEAQKIGKILGAIENEMNFPAMVYDPFSKETYYSSKKFVEMAEELTTQDFVEPSFDYMKETLCGNLKMIRYRFTAEKYTRPFSWINIPIVINKEIKAYFILLEAEELIDYFDQFAIRTGFLLLQSLYEQLYTAKRIGEAGLESLVRNVYDGKIEAEKVKVRAAEVGLSLEKDYLGFLIKGENGDLLNKKNIVDEAMEKELDFISCRKAVIDENNIFVLFCENISEEKLNRLAKRLEIDDIKVEIGYSDIPEKIELLDKLLKRCTKALEIGRLLLRTKKVFRYCSLGAMAWINIDEEELKLMKKQLEPLCITGDKEQLVETLRVYLEQNLNFTLTAESMYIHINTVRKRIEKISDLINLELDNPTNRLKLEILLQLIK